MSPDSIKITKHAIERFFGWSDSSSKDPEKTIRKLFSRAFEVRFNNIHAVLRLLHHDFQDTQYYFYEGWLFVCANNTLVTIERNTGKIGRDLIKVEGNTTNRV